jgi:hypothetical protein
MLPYELRNVLLHISIDAVYSNLSVRLDGESTVELNISRYWMARSSGLIDKNTSATGLRRSRLSTTRRV